ncbi:hypothetical protein FHL15_008187 [Xylaria flabelliformis]|uniref:Uncharacterized protein n=1 Tax=Xylaria flabelliformis TaxID=2512241 RepID=A0A553HSQ0_9PEZI|nr:hypothetical protein FHL15_008187 [Xylaria flabelliformis]
MSLPRDQSVPSDNGSLLWPVLSAFRQVYRFVSDYYNGNDLLPLSRQRHREQIIYYRKTCTKMASLCCFLGLLLLLGSLRACNAAAIQSSNTTAMMAVIDSSRWQPDNFDWETKRALSGPKETWKGLYVNLPDNKHAASVLTTEVALYRTNSVITSDLTIFNGTGPRTDIIPVLAWFAGRTWAAVNEGALTGLALASTISAIQGCVTDDGSAWADYNCVVALAGSVVSIGQAARGAYAGAKALGWFARSSATWLKSGLESIELSAFAKRELHPDRYQIIHERLISHVLNETLGHSEFIGYASIDHRLGAHLHSHAPISRFKHPCHGLMDLAAREHLTGTRFTISYANDLEKRSFDHLGRPQSFPAQAAEQRDLGSGLR